MFGLRIEATLDRERGEAPIELVLGPIKDEKTAAEFYTRTLNDNRVNLYLGMRYGFTVSTEEEWIKKIGADENLISWSMYASERLIGGVGLNAVDRVDRHAELGIVIGDREYWGKGVASASEAMVLEYAFNNIVAGGLNKVYARVFDGNTASRKALEKVGFKTVGIRHQDVWKNGRWLDVWFGEVLQEEWRIVREDAFERAGIVKFNLYPGCEDCGLEPII